MRILLLALVLIPGLVRSQTPEAMAQAANAFLASLDDAQRAKAQKSFEDANREDWHFVPMARQGLPLKEMTEPQRALAHALLKSVLSDAGYVKFTGTLVCEQILAEMEKNPARRDPDLYFFTFFGTPGGTAPWGWRAEGHHFSQNFTVIDHTLTATTPSFWGANPALTAGGKFDGHRPLADEEDLGRRLLGSLDEAALAKALIAPNAPKDVLSGDKRTVDPLNPAGLAASDMSAAQKETLLALIHEYLDNMEPDLAEIRVKKIQAAGFEKIGFAWAGSLEKGQGHYYRVQGPTFLLEYDNTQNQANHIHAVWRDFAGDFGRDLLREHLGKDHSPSK